MLSGRRRFAHRSRVDHRVVPEQRSAPAAPWLHHPLTDCTGRRRIDGRRQRAAARPAIGRSITPRRPLSRSWPWDDLEARAGEFVARQEKVAVLAMRPPLHTKRYMTWINAGKKPDQYAHNLYNHLRTLDRAGCARILVQELPQDERWAAILDRLQRASGGIGEDPLELAAPVETFDGQSFSNAAKLPADSPLELDPGQDPFARDSIRHSGRALRLAAVHHRCRAGAGSVPPPARRPCPESICTTRSSLCRTPRVIATLSAAGGCFDLATNGEVELVRRLGVAPARCIHTHPIKRDGDIRTALSFGVRRFVVDNPDELRKFAKFRNRSRAADPRGVPQRRRGCRFVAQIRLRPRRRSRTCWRSPRSCASRSKGCRSTPARRRPARGMHVAGHQCVPRLDAAAHESEATSCARSISAADFRPITSSPRVPIEEFCAPIRAAPWARSRRR